MEIAKSGSPVKCAGKSLPGWPYTCTIVIVTLIATIFSILISGFEFGIDNNMFHIPAVLRLYEHEAFQSDPFYQSLRYFVSGLYPALALVANEGNIENVFFAAFFISRWATFLALAAAMRSLGIERVWQTSFGVIWLSVSPTLVGYSLVGGSGLFIKYFTHTEVTYSLVLASLVLAANGRSIGALIANGLVFNINAFVAVWNGCAVLSALSTQWPKDTSARTAFARKTVAGFLASLVVAAPLLVWIVWTLSSPPPAPFDYRDFLRFYHPSHVLIEVAKIQSLLLLAAVAGSGGIALHLIGERARPWLRAYFALIAVFALGTILPNLTSSSTLLNLNLLRVDSLVQLLAVLAIVVAAMQSLSDRTSPVKAILAALALCCLIPPSRIATPAVGIVSAVTVLLAIRWWPQSLSQTIWRRWHRLLFVVLPLLAAYTVTTGFNESSRKQQETIARGQALREVAAWARSETGTQSTFLLPLQDLDDPNDFQWRARRKEWVNFKSGAAVMWQPSYYEIWHKRIVEVRALNGLTDQLNYACREGIDYVVHAGSTDVDALKPSWVAFRNAGFVVIKIVHNCSQ